MLLLALNLEWDQVSCDVVNLCNGRQDCGHRPDFGITEVKVERVLVGVWVVLDAQRSDRSLFLDVGLLVVRDVGEDGWIVGDELPDVLGG